MKFGQAEKQAYHNATRPRANTQGTISLKVFAPLPAEVIPPPKPVVPVNYGFWEERFIVWPRRLTSGRLAWCEYVWQRGNEFAEWEM